MIFHHNRLRTIHPRTVKVPKGIRCGAFVSHDDAVDELTPGLGVEGLTGVDGEFCADGGVFDDNKDVAPADECCTL